ncbi:RNA-binding cell elongation regulator Jag/EloR [Schinkia azotoformans]|uniref:RNA-binding cell elongation regulator Jag/EloR n=1 Tax=Schinkia azotoformans TaxID=1454 RepID=UPI002DB9CFBE|nr:RNA-binding cell elongation regulator Jag/EloR [Schinkia azotoformans]MEC1717265.1 RNA-binding cell elongation regulator Jag/EloR [Schinkia azotoformans]
MKQVTATGTGQTVDEAIESGLKELNVSKDKVDVSIIDEGKKGLFGVFGNRPAIVKLTVKIDPVFEAQTYLEDVIKKMGISATVEKSQHGKELSFKVSGEDVAILIGKRGQTLNSLQYLVQLVANKYSEEYLTVIVDAEDYRLRRKETLEQLAIRLAEKAKKTKTKVVLEPMPSFERKIIHSVLYDVDGVTTSSDGVEPNRHIVIIPN